MTLRLDMDGVIRGVSFANSVSTETPDGFVGRAWVETVGDVSGDKIIRMVADARTNGVSDFRQVTQRFPSGLELPVEYHTVRLGGSAGLIAIGKNLQAITTVQTSLIAAQHLREQDSWKLREVETRYRLLFEASDDPILLLRTADLQIMDANPAAIRAGALDFGRNFPAVVAPREQDAFRAMMARVAGQGRAPGILIHLGGSSVPWLVRGTLATAEPETIFLVQLAPVGSPILAMEQPAAKRSASVDDMIERLPDGFIVVDADGIVCRANRAFLDLVQAVAPAAVVGQPITRWLQRPGADASVLMASIKRHRIIRSFTTAIQGEMGIEAEVEISAAGDADSEPSHVGMVLRDVSRRLPSDAGRAETTIAPVSNAADRLLTPLVELTEQIGRVPLLELVRDTVGLVERHCIVTALERVHGNRTAAAELLGLSRQSLYAKLGRHGMGTPSDLGVTVDH